jgi:hypothetical protein
MQTQLPAPSDSINSAAELASTATSRQNQAGWLALLAAGPILLLVLRLFPALDREMLHNPTGHLLITLTAALLGVILALLVLHIAWRARDGRVFLVGLGFLGSASILITHSLATPDVLMSGRGVATSLSALVSLFVGAVLFAASGLEITPRLNRLLVRFARLWLVVFLAVYLAYNWFVLVTLPELMIARASGQLQPAGEHETHPNVAAGEYGEYVAPLPAETTMPPIVSADLVERVKTLFVIVGLGVLCVRAVAPLPALPPRALACRPWPDLRDRLLRSRAADPVFLDFLRALVLAIPRPGACRLRGDQRGRAGRLPPGCDRRGPARKPVSLWHPRAAASQL